MDWKKIQRVRHWIEIGDYIHPEFLNSATEIDDFNYSRLLHDINEGKELSKKEVQELARKEVFAQALEDLKNCPKGQGHKYRDIVAEVFALSLNNIVDVALIRREFPCKGGRGDFELPLRIERMNKYQLFKSWSSDYKIRSIIVEVKNTKGKATPSDICNCYVILLPQILASLGY